MDRLDAMALFVMAVEKGSLAAAARAQGRSAAAATRALAMLERAAGEALLLRSTRKLRVTEAGERHLAVWRDVLKALGRLDARHDATELRGSVMLTAPELFGRLAVLPHVEDFLAGNPGVSGRVMLVNRMVDLVGEGVDLAVRLAPLDDSGLRAVRLGEVRTFVCASPAYLALHGTPTKPADLPAHLCVGLNVGSDGERWSFGRPGGGSRAVRVRTRLSVNSAAAAIEAAARGCGIIQARSYQVADAVAQGSLVRLMPAWEGPPTPVHLLFPEHRGIGGAVRALMDHLTPRLRRDLASERASIMT